MDRLTDNEAVILMMLQTAEEREQGVRQFEREFTSEIMKAALFERNHPGSRARIQELIKGFDGVSDEEKTRRVEEDESS